MEETPTQSQRSLIVHGLAWNTIYQIYSAVLGLGVMLITVRLISKSEFGQVAAVMGIVGLLNVFNCERYVSHAIQLAKSDTEPDWTLYWGIACRLQLVLFLGCNATAGLLWFFPEYAPVAPLLHLASAAMLLEPAARLRPAMLRRTLDYKRLRMIGLVCNTIQAAFTLTLAACGYGAIGLVLGGSLIYVLPTVYELFFIHRWRPSGGWWPALDPDQTPVVRAFGLHQTAKEGLTALRGALESAALPGLIGFAGMGLWNRSQVLFQTSAGRVIHLMAETAYPLLPRSRDDATRYSRHATLFAQVMVSITLLCGCFIAVEGISLSRVFYGSKWIEVDALILPGTLFGCGTALLLTADGVLLGANSLRRRLFAFSLQALASVAGILLLFAAPELPRYAWFIGVGQMVVGFVAMEMCRDYFRPCWRKKIWLPALIAGLMGMGAVTLVHCYMSLPGFTRLLIGATCYAAVATTLMRLLFPEFLREILGLLPGGKWLFGWLRL